MKKKKWIKTDYSDWSLEVKIRLRLFGLSFLKKDNVLVLDAYHGNGIVWQKVCERAPEKNIQVVGIDILPKKSVSVLKGDNRKFLKSMDLNVFDVIDLDAYGIPADQLQILFDRNYHGTIFFTMAAVGFSAVPIKLLEKNGISKEMRKKCPTIFGSRALEYAFNFLALYGVQKCHYYRKDKDKNFHSYFYFTI